MIGILPKTRDEVLTLQGLLSFPYAFGAVDGCQLRIQCPIGEAARKDYWCFKQFYSIILMAIVDGKGRFMWSSAGMPGNCHDATLLQASNIWQHLPTICHLSVDHVGAISIPAMILGDNAFPFRSWLMKRYTQANATPDQKKFNKRHSSSRVVVENAFGWLKMRFRELFRGTESSPENLKFAALAAVTLHNIMIDQNEPMMLENPDNPGQEIVWLQRAEFADEGRGHAATVRDLILPLVL